MLKVPNEDVFRNLVNKIEDEYDLENRLNRYKNQSKLIEFASNLGLPVIDDAVRALFVADFILTASETPSGGTDEDRYRSVISSFILGLFRCSSSDSLMRMFFFAYKTAIAIRRQDLFMAGRGLTRKASLIRLKDSYITPYLTIASEILGKGPCGWELGILSAALQRMYPDTEIKQFEKVPEYTNYKILTEYVWRLLLSYSKYYSVETNPDPVIPNMKESKSILLFETKDPSLVSLWGTPITSTNVFRLKVGLPSFVKFLNQSFDDKQLILIRGRILDTMEHFFIVRDPFTTSKPIFIIRTPADELNLSRVSTILHFRGLEQDGWKPVFISKDKPVKPKDLTVTKPKEIAVVTDEEKEELPIVKGGFFSKFKRKIFGAKTEPTIDAKSVPKEPKIILKKEVKTDEKRVGLPPFMSQSSFLAQGITVDAVSDMDLFELFDTLREEKYFVIGTFETDFEKTNTLFLTKTTNTSPSSVVTFFNALDQEISKLYNNCFDDHQVLLEELFFMAEDGQKLIISLNGNQQIVVGTIATTYVEKIIDWQSRDKEQEPLQRRSLHMRTQQLLAARRHTPFSEAVERIYGSNFHVEAAKLITLDQPIFSLR